jgi:hypothetical protein
MDKGMNKYIKRIIAFISLIYTTNLFAGCPPPEKHWVALKCNPGYIQVIDPSSNYAKESSQFISDIMTTGEQIKTAINEGTEAQIKSFQDQIKKLMTRLMEMEQVQLKDRLNQDKAMRELEMNYKANIAEEESRQANAVLFKDDTKEEMKLIEKTLEDNPDLPVTNLILALTEQYDVGGQTIPIPIKSAEGVCDEESIEAGHCSVQKAVTPGKKLQKLFKACSDQKSELARKLQEKKARKAGLVASSKKASKTINAEDATAEMATNIETQMESSCTPSQYMNKLCGTNLSQEDFQEKVALNHIIPNGNVSPANLLNPTFYGGEALRKYDDKTKQDLISKALSKEEVQEDPEQKSIPINLTYKNSTQYSAALQFVDNITGSTLVSNQLPKDRKKQSSAGFQTMYNKRMAILNLIRSSFMDSINRRTGEKIAEAIANGTDFNEIEEPVKESVLGASEIDILINKVDKMFSTVAVKANAELGGNGSLDEIENGSERQIKQVQLETLKLQTEIVLKEFFENEKIELLKSAQISSIVNSPEMINYLKQLRR